MTDKLRSQSTKFPCGECNEECKDGSLSCFKCGSWYHSGTCSGVQAAVLKNLAKTPGLLWLCKNCVEVGKNQLRNEPTPENTQLAKKLEKIEKAVAATANIEKTIKLEFDAKFNKLESSVEAKLDTLLKKQELIPSEIQTSWNKQPSVQPTSIKKIMKETLIQQERDKIDTINREPNIVLFNVPESDGNSAEKRQEDDIKFFKELWKEGLQLNFQLDIENAVRLGRRIPANNEENDRPPRPRPLKIVLGSRVEADEVFKNLYNLRDAETKFKSISISRDHSKQTRETIKVMIEDAKRKDAENASNYMYSVKGTGSDLQLVRRKRRVNRPPPPPAEDD